MSYAVAQPGEKKRPGVVTAATWLLYLTAFLQLLGAAVTALQLGPMREVVTDAFKDRPEDEQIGGTVAVVVLIVIIVLSVLLGVGFAVLGYLDGRGKQPARIVTWVIAGLSVLCLGCNQLGTLASGSLGSTAESAEIEEKLAALVPPWQEVLGTVTSIVSLLAMIAVIILLALPAANDFFRKEQEVWVPPTWPGGAPPLPPSIPPSQAGPGPYGPTGGAF